MPPSYGNRAFTHITATSDGTLFQAGGHKFSGGYSVPRDLWVSRDQGASWSAVGPVNWGDLVLACGPHALFFGGAVAVTSDGGRSFYTVAQSLKPDGSTCGVRVLRVLERLERSTGQS